MDELYPIIASTGRKLSAFDDRVKALLAKVAEYDETPDGGYAEIVSSLKDYISATATPLEEYLARYAKLLKLYLYD